MGQGRGQLSHEERRRIAGLQGEGRSARQIAAALARSPSTIAAELKRNAGADGRYDADEAQAQAQRRARRRRGSRLEHDDALRERVLGMLARGLSPEQVAGRLNREAGRTVLSHETIYRFIYDQMARTKDYRWARLLPRGRTRRRRRGSRRGGGSVDFIHLRRPLSERPAEAEQRSELGHWEADLMQFGRGGPSLLVLQERHTRALLAAALPSKAADPLIQALRRLLASLPAALRRSVSFDNGTEFVRHHELHALGVETFFCDPHAPWQKGGVENAIGRLRRELPRTTQLTALSRRALNRLLQRYNNTPRKCLDYQSPAELLREQLSCLTLEPTVRPRGGRAVAGAVRGDDGDVCADRGGNQLRGLRTRRMGQDDRRWAAVRRAGAVVESVRRVGANLSGVRRIRARARAATSGGA